MPQRLRIDYSRKISSQTDGTFYTDSLGGGWEFDIPDDADYRTEYEKGLATVKSAVDDLFEGNRVIPEQKPATLPGERLTGNPQPQAKEAPKANGEIVEGQEYQFTNARVWDVKKDRTQRGKEFIVVRIGSKEQIPGTGYARVKTFNPYMISKLAALREGDHIDIRGAFEGWDGRDGRMFDFNPVEVERVRDVRAD